jgi:hypothetical protein
MADTHLSGVPFAYAVHEPADRLAVGRRFQVFCLAERAWSGQDCAPCIGGAGSEDRGLSSRYEGKADASVEKLTEQGATNSGKPGTTQDWTKPLDVEFFLCCRQLGIPGIRSGWWHCIPLHQEGFKQWARV